MTTSYVSSYSLVIIGFNRLEKANSGSFAVDLHQWRTSNLEQSQVEIHCPLIIIPMSQLVSILLYLKRSLKDYH